MTCDAKNEFRQISPANEGKHEGSRGFQSNPNRSNEVTKSRLEDGLPLTPGNRPRQSASRLCNDMNADRKLKVSIEPGSGLTHHDMSALERKYDGTYMALAERLKTRRWLRKCDERTLPQETLNLCDDLLLSLTPNMIANRLGAGLQQHLRDDEEEEEDLAFLGQQFDAADDVEDLEGILESGQLVSFETVC